MDVLCGFGDHGSGKFVAEPMPERDRAVIPTR